MKKNNKKGFTLAELLIVVAIIAVLVAVAIPVFTSQLNKSKYSTDLANARSIYAELTADYLSNGGAQKVSVNPASVSAGATKVPVSVTNTEAGTSNTYTFSGIVGVTFTLGDASSSPKVVVAACDAANATEVTFGGSGS